MNHLSIIAKSLVGNSDFVISSGECGLNASSDLRDQLLGAHAAFATAEENPYALEGSAYAIYADEDESLLRRVTSTSPGSLIAKVSNDIIRSKRAYLDAKSEPVSQWLFHT
jgi:hypothetical protein